MSSYAMPDLSDADYIVTDPMTSIAFEEHPTMNLRWSLDRLEQEWVVRSYRNGACERNETEWRPIPVHVPGTLPPAREAASGE